MEGIHFLMTKKKKKKLKFGVLSKVSCTKVIIGLKPTLFLSDESAKQAML